jgi:hypothetical protein
MDKADLPIFQFAGAMGKHIQANVLLHWQEQMSCILVYAIEAIFAENNAIHVLNHFQSSDSCVQTARL